MVKSIQAYFIYSDLDMYYEPVSRFWASRHRALSLIE